MEIGDEYKNEEQTNSFIKFSVDNSGEIYCECEFYEQYCDVNNFADMFVQVFSGELANGTFIFLTDQLVGQHKGEIARVLTSLLRTKLDGKIQDKLGQEVVVKPTDLANRINTHKEE